MQSESWLPYVPLLQPVLAPFVQISEGSVNGNPFSDLTIDPAMGPTVGPIAFSVIYMPCRHLFWMPFESYTYILEQRHKTLENTSFHLDPWGWMGVCPNSCPCRKTAWEGE